MYKVELYFKTPPAVGPGGNNAEGLPNYTGISNPLIFAMERQWPEWDEDGEMYIFTNAATKADVVVNPDSLDLYMISPIETSEVPNE